MATFRYLKSNARKEHTRSNMTESTRAILRSWLWADYLLYDHFKAKFQQKVQEFGQVRMGEQIRQLQQVRVYLYRIVPSLCTLYGKHSVTPSFCYRVVCNFGMLLKIVLSTTVILYIFSQNFDHFLKEE